MIEQIAKYFQGETSNALWKLCKDLWEKAEDKSAEVKTAKDYWDGKLIKQIVANVYFPDQKHTNDNIVNSIIETIVCNMLDARFALAVVPDTGAFYDYTAMKEAHAIADIFNEEIKNIFKRNKMEKVKEQVARNGFLGGLSASQTNWDFKKRSDGDVVIKYRDSENLRWSKGVQELGECSMIAHYEEKSSAEAKSIYAKNPDGTYNNELCKLIDDISEVTAGEGSRKYSSAIINYSDSSNNTAGRVYAEGTIGGIREGKVCKLVCMYLLDDSVFAPDEKDSEEEQAVKTDAILKYPYGRMIVFSLNDKHKAILKDEPLTQEFKNLGNIDVFNPVYWDGIKGKSIAEILIPIQDRINGLYYKYREKISYDFDTILVDSEFGMEDNAIVKGAVTRVKDLRAYDKTPSVLTNNGIEKASKILEMIEQLKTKAYQMVRINETMLYGARQKGTTSGEQVESLQESPMAGIRAYQQNFIDWLISVGEKCLLYIAQNYTDQRLIELSTDMDGAKMARINTNSTDKPMEVVNQTIQPRERYVELLDEAMKAIKVIKYNPKWKMKVDVIAGTEIPRSRREQAGMADFLLEKGILGDINDPDTVDLYAKMQDIPNGRDIVCNMRRKQKQDSTKPMYFDMLSNPEICKSIGALISDLAGFTEARAAILQQLGLPVNPDTISVAPVQEVMRQVDPHHLMSVVPKATSPDPIEQAKGDAVSKVELLNDSAKSAATLMREVKNDAKV